LSAARRTVGVALRGAAERLAAAGKDGARLDAEVLLSHVLGGPRHRLITERDRTLDPAERQAFDELIARRIAGEPVAYLTGQREFFSLTFAVDRRVLVPRPETEHVVEAAADALAACRQANERRGSVDRPLTVVDVGTGSGAIAIALASELRRRVPDPVTIVAVDLSCDALDVARANADRLLAPGALRFCRADLLSAVRTASVDVVASNPPYLSDDEIDAVSTEVAAEPVAALRGGGMDGTRILRELLSDATRVLRPGGLVVSEIGATQGEAVAALARDLGFAEAHVLPDLAGLDRVLVARLA
jgi:release factor glutamine methyltransferase